MADYTQSTFFTAKDSLTTGDPNKIVRGSEVDIELAAISTAVGTKVDQAGAGISLSGKSVSLDIDGLTVTTVVDPANDYVPMYDASASAVRKVDINDIVNYWGLNRFITAGNGLSGGGALNNDRTIALDLNELTAESSLASDDYIACYDSSGGHSAKITVTALSNTLEVYMNHDDLVGFVSDEHVAHSAVSITAGSGLTGGGTIASSRTLNVGAGTGITVAANDVSIAGNVLRHASLGSGTVSVQSGGSPSGGSDGDIILIY